MLANSKKTIARILTLYLGTSIVFLCIIFFYLEKKESENIIFTQMANFRDISFEINDSLRRFRTQENGVEMALSEVSKSISVPFAVYDRDNNLLFSTLTRNPSQSELEYGFYRVGDKIIASPELIPHRGKKHRRTPPYRIFIEDDSVDLDILFMRLKLGVYFVLTLLAMGVVAFFLVRLFLRPLNDYIKGLDAFIKDSTHEINTPLSVILMSVEGLNVQDSAKNSAESSNKIPPNMAKKLERIKLASLQLSRIYDNLVAYNFMPNPKQNAKILCLDSLLSQRLEYFSPFFTQRNISIKSDIKPCKIHAREDKMIILFDNLISNAIKYNIKGGNIAVIMKMGYFSIENSGCVIESKNLDKIFERYERFNVSEGGFGIGLSLVKSICDDYKIRLHAQSSKDDKANETKTRFILEWREADLA